MVFQSLHHCALDESSLSSIGRVRIDKKTAVGSSCLMQGSQSRESRTDRSMVLVSRASGCLFGHSNP